MELHKVLAAIAAASLVVGCGGDAPASLSTSAPRSAHSALASNVTSFSGSRANYTITKSGSAYSVTDNTGVDGTISVGSTQAAKFTDVTLNLGIGDQSKTLAAPDLKLLIELYIAFFNRVPDADGLSYWIDQFKAGQTLGQISDSFYAAAVQFSSLTGYSSTMSNVDFVKVIYKNVLGRSDATAPPDADVQYWAGELASGRSSKGNLISVMLASAHSFTNDATWAWVPRLLDNKVAAANYFAVQQGLNYNTSEESISKTMAIAAAVTSSDTSAAISLAGMTDTYFNLAPTPSSVSGTAATGAPLAGVTLTLKDSSGKTATAVTGSDGSYSIDTAGLVGPFLLQATTGDGIKLYSVSADTAANTMVNLTPLTDLIVRSWYGVKAVSPDTAFANLAANPAPAPAVVSVIHTVVKNIVQLWLDRAGVSTETFNTISTPFAANGSGIDLVLSRISLNRSTGAITITDGVTTQNTNVSYASGRIDVATTTTDADYSSSSASSNTVPVQTTENTALNDIAERLNSFANIINARGASLQSSDLLPFLASDLLQEGLNRTQYASNLAAQFAGNGQTISFSVHRLKSIDIAGNVADVRFQMTASKNGRTQNEQVEFAMKKVGGTWLIHGDQRIAAVHISAEMRANQGSEICPGGQLVSVDVQAPHGTVSGVTISGGSWSATPLITNAMILDAAGPLDHYIAETPCHVGSTLPPVPAAGTVFTVTLSTASGMVSYQETLNALTTDGVTITAPTTGSMTAAHPGSPLAVSWRLPTTFAIASVNLRAIAFTGDPTDAATLSCNTDSTGGEEILTITATSGNITIPDSCGGMPVTGANLNLSVDGINGERATSLYLLR